MRRPYARPLLCPLSRVAVWGSGHVVWDADPEVPTVPVTRDMLLTELQNLLRLTAAEQTTATLRRTQAGDESLGRELRDNAGQAAERSALLTQAIRTVGGVPDVVGSALGRAGAVLTAQVNQVQTVQQALLGDLALEHQLRERARFARALAVSLGEERVVPALERLDRAHTATIAWLEQRLAEIGRSGGSRLRATPLQRSLALSRRLASLPLGFVAAGVNRLSAQLARQVPAPVAEAAARAAAAGDRVIDLTVEAGRRATVGQDAGLHTAEAARGAAQTARDDVAQAVREAVVQPTRAATDLASDLASELSEGALRAQEAVRAADRTGEALAATGGEEDLDEDRPPFAGYASLSGDTVMRHARDTGDVDELRRTLAFEQAHKARKGVLRALQDRLTELSSTV